MKRDMILFIDDILESIVDIESFTDKVSKEEFIKNKEKQNAVVRSIEIIGEAVKNLPIDFIGKYPEVPWSDIAGFRDVMVHAYFVIDLEKVWKVIKKDLPDLKNKILKIKKDLEIKDNKKNKIKKISNK